ncbi:MAG: bifunctional phosphoribosylaminoimidazolecarboxamide formyltransferase/IMP cyclohydrolase [Phycisphaerae bacterium]|nr:bifunctional phosphoribosylaminoimidazolecarboxamide formyltransferase/IMP cyclohydrolase [Phycisphaerae bacterium]
MSDVEIKRALIAVYDKTGIAEFAKALVEEFGIEIISTGGTARHLKEAGIPVTMVAEITGFPEMLDGRVKTLHPKIHAAILADREKPEHMRQLEEHGIKPIDMVVVTLYPFEETIKKPDCTLAEAIEMIDIGGPCLLRAAAKNHRHVLPLCSRHSYEAILNALRGGSSEDLASKRRHHARIAFWSTGRYDRQVTAYLEQHEPGSICDDAMTEQLFRLPNLGQAEVLRYGENPHQKGELRPISAEGQSDPTEEPVIANRCYEGGMSFNNYVDASSALELCKDLHWAVREAEPSGTPARYSCSFIKHTNACGAAVASDPIEAYRKAYLGDPNAAMGGILVTDFEVDRGFAAAVMDTYATWGRSAGVGGFFVEVLVAPNIEDDAEQLIRESKKWGQRVRLLRVGPMTKPLDMVKCDLKKVSGGILFQTRDLIGLNEDQWKVVTERTPTAAEMSDLRLAWLICKHTKSNAITVCKDGMLIGNGAGQMSRVMSCRIATWLAKENGHAEKLKGAVAASDAFFPFRDGPDILADAGATAIIQPGGSKRDADTIAACNERGLAMIFTGTRHFKH